MDKKNEKYNIYNVIDLKQAWRQGVMIGALTGTPTLDINNFDEWFKDWQNHRTSIDIVAKTSDK